MKSPEGGSFDFVCIYVPSLLFGIIPGSVLYPGEELEGGGGTGRRKVVSGHGMEAPRRKLRNAVLMSVVSSFTHMPAVCFSRIVVVSCPKEITKAATPWTDTSSARAATPPASGCSPPRPAPTCKFSRLLRWLVGDAEKKETQEEDKKRNGKIQERQSSRGMVSVLHLILTFL